MMNEASSRSVAVSLGSRLPKRMTPSGARRAPTARVMPSTSRALAKSEPRIEVCATTTSPAERANSTTNSSGRFPSVNWSTPVVAGPNRSPIDSVANETIQASPARATAPRRNTATSGAPARYSTAVRTAAATTAAMSAIRGVPRAERVVASVTARDTTRRPRRGPRAVHRGAVPATAHARAVSSNGPSPTPRRRR